MGLNSKASNPYQNDSGLFHNKLGIFDRAELEMVEYDITNQKANDILENNDVLYINNIKKYSLEHQRAIHQYLFEDIYEWAGKIRTIPYSKAMENGLTSVFAPPDLIESYWEKLEKQTQLFILYNNLEFEYKIEQLTDIFIQANHIHPFPEGNGRSLQVLMQQLAKEQGIYLDYSNNIARDWNEASAVSAVYGKVEIDPKDGSKYMIPEPPNKEPIRKIFRQMAKSIY